VRNAQRVYTADAFPHDHEDAAAMLAQIQQMRRDLAEGEADREA
jgi:hypothetical protein